MILATSNRSQRLLLVTYIGQVMPEDFDAVLPNLRELVAELPGGFRLLVDFSLLEAMNVGCAPAVGRQMEMFDAAGVALVVRVIPDRGKDIGMNILTHFHYRRRPRVMTCASFAEGLSALDA